jgi:hypothetical protein
MPGILVLLGLGLLFLLYGFALVIYGPDGKGEGWTLSWVLFTTGCIGWGALFIVIGLVFLFTGGF